MSLPMWHDVCVIDFAMSKCQKNIQASIKDIDESLRLMTMKKRQGSLDLVPPDFQP